MTQNSLLQDWDNSFALPPFDRISDDEFAEAMDVALAEARAEIGAIAGNPDAATFENTLEALERSERLLDRVAAVLFNLAHSDSNEARRALEIEISPKLAEYSAEVTTNKALFERIDTAWRNREAENLSGEQLRVLENYRRDFIRAGAMLAGEDRERFKSIRSRLASLGTTFSQNVLADESDWHLEIAGEDADALPQFLSEAAAVAAQERRIDGYAITLNRSLIVPFLQFSPNRSLRETAFKAWASRGANGGKTDNRGIIAETLELRRELAGLLGYESYADYKLETEMAKTPAAVSDLLMAVWKPARSRAEDDAAILLEAMKSDGLNGDLEPWDWHYFAERRRREEHDLDEPRIKQYFQLDLMVEAAFACAHRLFGLTFLPLDVPLYHPDCRAWEVKRDGRHMAVFIGDYYARSSKRSGAWCSGFRSQQRLDGDVRPIVVNVCNFTKPAEGEPCLLSFDDSRTLFHEFGHALHSMLSDVTYPCISGTSVTADFVELPSQLFEHWLETPEVLSEFALDAETSQPIPEDLMGRLLAARNYDQGFSTTEYVASALVDMRFHESDTPEDPIAAQEKVLSEIGMPAAIRMRHAAPHFAHIFAGDGYSAGYYSYMWSEVMDADAFEAFREAGGPFDQETARRLEQNILSAGGSKLPEELYLAFRGRLPTVESLLRKRGLDSGGPVESNR